MKPTQILACLLAAVLPGVAGVRGGSTEVARSASPPQVVTLSEKEIAEVKQKLPLLRTDMTVQEALVVLGLDSYSGRLFELSGHSGGSGSVVYSLAEGHRFSLSYMDVGLRSSRILEAELDGARWRASDERKRERAAWVEKCLHDFEAIKVGMTRKEILEQLHMDGGIQFPTYLRLVHPECDRFKIDVGFEVRRDEKNQGRAIESPDDKATKVSRPYIDRMVID
jgi:hypothetical protein